MRLIGKEKQAARKRLLKDNARRTGMLAVLHHHARGEETFLCGKPYNRLDAASDDRSVACNNCQRAKNVLLKTADGRKRLGVDKYTGEPVKA